MAEYKCTRIVSNEEIEHAYYPDWVYNDKGAIVPSRLNQYIAQLAQYIKRKIKKNPAA